MLIEKSRGKIEKIVVKDKKKGNDIEIEFRKIKHKENDYFPKEFINKGPYDDNKGAKTDDIDWSYSSDGFTNGIKLVDKTTNANGRITLHLKS